MPRQRTHYGSFLWAFTCLELTRNSLLCKHFKRFTRCLCFCCSSGLDVSNTMSRIWLTCASFLSRHWSFTLCCCSFVQNTCHKESNASIHTAESHTILLNTIPMKYCFASQCKTFFGESPHRTIMWLHTLLYNVITFIY